MKKKRQKKTKKKEQRTLIVGNNSPVLPGIQKLLHIWYWKDMLLIEFVIVVVADTAILPERNDTVILIIKMITA